MRRVVRNLVGVSLAFLAVGAAIGAAKHGGGGFGYLLAFIFAAGAVRTWYVPGRGGRQQ